MSFPIIFLTSLKKATSLPTLLRLIVINAELILSNAFSATNYFFKHCLVGYINFQVLNQPSIFEINHLIIVNNFY